MYTYHHTLFRQVGNFIERETLLYGGWVVVGLLLGMAFMFPMLWWCVFLGGVLFLLIASSSPPALIWRGGWIAGFVKFLCVLSWGWSLYPLTWLNIESSTLAGLLIFIYWVIIAGVMAVSVAVLARLVSLVLTTWKIVFIPFIWIGAELFGSLLYSLLLWGPGSTPNLHFSFGYIGLPVVHTNFLLSWAHWGGIYSAGLIVVSVCLVVYIFLQNHPYRFRGLLTILLMLLVTHFTVPITDTPPVALAAVDTRFSAEFSQQPDSFKLRQEELIRAVRSSYMRGVDYVVFPEDSRFSKTIQKNMYAQSTEALFSQDKVVFDSIRTQNVSGQTVLRGVFYDMADGEIYWLDKEYLTPQGEFVPYLVSLALAGVSSPWKTELYDHLSYRSSHAVSGFPSNQSLPAVLFCMESVSPVGVRKALRKQPSAFVIHPMSHSWFNDSEIVRYQLRLMLRAQSRWNNVPIVTVGNMVSGTTYYPNGKTDSGTIVSQSQYWTVRIVTL